MAVREEINNGLDNVESNVNELLDLAKDLQADIEEMDTKNDLLDLSNQAQLIDAMVIKLEILSKELY